MKRSPVSSSCLQRGGTTNNSTNSTSLLGNCATKPASVTILNTETLPTYSCERYYMLSEIEMNSPPVIFLSHLEQNGDASTVGDRDTIDTEAETDDVITRKNTAQHQSTQNSMFPPCLILYMLWRPTDDQDAESFLLKTLETKVNRLQQHVDLVPFEEVASRILMRNNNSIPSRDPIFNKTGATVSGKTNEKGPDDAVTGTRIGAKNTGVTREDMAEHEQEVTNGSSSTASGIKKPKCSVYIVVDHVLPGQTITTDGHHKASEQLARAVAMHETYRALVQGITVGVSNHVRAAPGLETCHDAVSLGAKDRRKVEKPMAKSFLGIVTDSPDDMLGLADPNECDAAQGVQQIIISAEYNGRGNLQSFATRAHSVWRQRHGLPPPQLTTARRTPRRIRRLPTRNSRETEFLVYDCIAILVLILYMSFHSGHLLFQKQQQQQEMG